MAWFFLSKVIGVHQIIKHLRKAISILAGNLNSGLSYLITTVAVVSSSYSFFKVKITIYKT